MEDTQTTKKRRRFSSEYKFHVALEAAKGQRTISELSSEYSVHPNQISQWKRQLLENGADVFSQDGSKEQRDQEAVQTELYEQIGRLKMEWEWVKKSLPSSPEAKRALVESNHPQLSVRHQCELLGLNRSTLYYQPVGESAHNLHLMRLFDEQYLRTPFYGWPRMTAYLRRQGYAVNHKRVQRLMQKMGLQALYPKPRTSVITKQHKV